MNNKTSLDRFKSNMEILLDIISEMFQEASENNLVEENFGFFNIMKPIILNCSSEKVIVNFIKKTNEYWEKLRNKDIEYFKELGLGLFNIVQDKGVDSYKGQQTYGFLDKIKDSHLESFKKILEAEYQKDGESFEIFDEERKNDVWNILHSFVRISIIFVHEKREFKDGKYTNEFFPEIKIKENVSKWGIKSIKF